MVDATRAPDRRQPSRRRILGAAVVAATLIYGASYIAVRRGHLLIHYQSCTRPYDDRVDLPDPGIPLRWFLAGPDAVPWGFYAYGAPAVGFRPLMLVEQRCWWMASAWRSERCG